MEVPSTWNCTLRPEWQCRPHCHSTSSVPKRYVQGRVEVPSTWNCTLRAEWQCRPHCHSTSSVRAARPHTATRCRAYQDGALRAEWQCHPHGTARSGSSGSAAHTATRRRAYGLHALTLPLDVERTETVRSGPNGRAAEAPVGGDRRPGTCSGVPSRRPGGLPTTRVPRARGARGICARQEPPRVRPGPARRSRRCECCAEIDEYVAQK